MSNSNSSYASNTNSWNPRLPPYTNIKSANSSVPRAANVLTNMKKTSNAASGLMKLSASRKGRKTTRKTTRRRNTRRRR